LYVTVNYDEDGICEAFTNTGKAGGCPSQSEATSRLVSIALRSGMSADTIVDQLKGIRCSSTIRQQGMSCTSCPDAIVRVVKKVGDMIKNGASTIEPSSAGSAKDKNPQPHTLSVQQFRFCPECATELEHDGGCVFCRNCGFSKCG
jgi:ribonucleoside-diphosphate reductase alpha chain